VAVIYSSLYFTLAFLLAYKELLGTYFIFFNAIGYFVPTLLVLSNEKRASSRNAAIVVTIMSGVCNLICLLIIIVDWASQGSTYLNMENVEGLFSALIFVIVAQGVFLLLSVITVYLLSQMQPINKKKRT
jgi:hypothetical protein